MANIHICGASRGIGLELARQHLAAGDRLFAYARDPEASQGLAELAGDRLSAHVMDIASDASVAAGVADTAGEDADIVYVVGGISGKLEPMLEPGDWDTFDEAIETMVKGPLRVVRGFLPRLERGARIIVFSSQLAASTWPYGGFYPYVAAKAAVNRLMRSVATDLKDRGIVVGLVHPGWVQTDMGGPNAEISVEESASGVRKLAEEWTLERSGDFYKWNGEPHAW